jgi:hypothetical protein
MAEKKSNQVSELEQSLKVLANLTNNKRLYDRIIMLLQQMWMGNQYGLRNIHQFMDLADYNWLKNRKSKAQRQGLRIVK